MKKLIIETATGMKVFGEQKQYGVSVSYEAQGKIWQHVGHENCQGCGIELDAVLNWCSRSDDFKAALVANFGTKSFY